MSELLYNYFNDPRNWEGNLRGAKNVFKEGMDAMLAVKRPRANRGRYAFKSCRKTKAYRKSPVQQKTITAPPSRTIDTKYSDVYGTIAGLKNSAPYQYSCPAIAQGAAEGQRIGNDVRILKLIVSLELSHGSSTLDQTFRLIIVRWKTGNDGTSPGLSSVLKIDNSGFYTPNSFRNADSLEDFEILLDKQILIDNNYSASHGARCNQYMINTCFPQRYSGAASTSIIRNPIWAWVVTNQPNTTTGATGQLLIRTIYSDV